MSKFKISQFKYANLCNWVRGAYYKSFKSFRHTHNLKTKQNSGCISLLLAYYDCMVQICMILIPPFLSVVLCASTGRLDVLISYYYGNKSSAPLFRLWSYSSGRMRKCLNDSKVPGIKPRPSCMASCSSIHCLSDKINLILFTESKITQSVVVAL